MTIKLKRRKVTILLTIVVLLLPFLIGMYFHLIPTQTFQQDYYSQLAATQAREIALTYTNGGTVQEIELLDEYYRFTIKQDLLLHQLYINIDDQSIISFTHSPSEFTTYDDPIHAFASLHIQTIGDDIPFTIRTLWIDSEFTFYANGNSVVV